MLFLSLPQWESGTELAILLTRHLKQELIPVSKELLGKQLILPSLPGMHVHNSTWIEALYYNSTVSLNTTLLASCRKNIGRCNGLILDGVLCGSILVNTNTLFMVKSYFYTYVYYTNIIVLYSSWHPISHTHSHTHTLTHSHSPLPDMILELFSLYSGTRKDFATDIPAQCQVKVEVDPREHFMRAALKLVKSISRVMFRNQA